MSGSGGRRGDEELVDEVVAAIERVVHSVGKARDALLDLPRRQRSIAKNQTTSGQ